MVDKWKSAQPIAFINSIKINLYFWLCCQLWQGQNDFKSAMNLNYYIFYRLSRRNSFRLWDELLIEKDLQKRLSDSFNICLDKIGEEHTFKIFIKLPTKIVFKWILSVVSLCEKYKDIANFHCYWVKIILKHISCLQNWISLLSKTNNCYVQNR